MNRLEQLRLDAALSVAQVAEKSKVPARTIYRLENGSVRRPHNLDHLKALADLFEVPASSLLLDAIPPADRKAS